MWKNRIEKSKAREFVLNSSSVNSYLSLTGEDQADLRMGVDKKIITEETSVILPERVLKIAKIIERSLKKWYPFKLPMIFNDELSNLPPNHYDLAYLDFCGQATSRDLMWISKNTFNNLHITINTRYRANPTAKQIWNVIPYKIQQTQKMEFAFLKEYGESAIHLAAAYRIFFDYVIMNGFKYDWNFLPYQDTDPMILISLLNIKKTRPNSQNIFNNEFLKEIKFFEDKPPFNGDTSVKTKQSPEALVNSFPEASKDYDKFRGWKRSLTVYCQNKEKETGTPAPRFKAAIKMRLAKMGFDNSNV